jgi:acyl-CoA hydrolase
VQVTNLPQLVIANDRLTAINNTTQMDLQGQAASESSGHRHISGSGGQLQFVRAGHASNGGKSFISMSSTYQRANVRRSRIVLNLTPGNVVTAPRSDMMFVVTEYGLVNLKGSPNQRPGPRVSCVTERVSGTDVRDIRRAYLDDMVPLKTRAPSRRVRLSTCPGHQATPA